MILVNGQPADAVSVLDRGLAYGDGVFRTLRTQAGQPLWWRDHYAKLSADSAALMLDCPDETELRAEVCRVARLDDASWLPAGWTTLLNNALYEDLD